METVGDSIYPSSRYSALVRDDGSLYKTQLDELTKIAQSSEEKKKLIQEARQVISNAASQGRYLIKEERRRLDLIVIDVEYNK